jgi:hypothetical protein
MVKAKIVGANTAQELEAKINNWFGRENPEVIRTHYDADGAEFIYTAFILYRESPEVRR